uniref:ATPase family AAA domain-containing protein 5 n=1 Tax=Sphenodon punctatus TaxID=8508 RepID=A0A8D0GH45_SPHPU
MTFCQENNEEKTQNRSGEKQEDILSKAKNKGVGAEEPSKKSATSLILFEEVDIIFDEDAGFLSAIKTFMATAKRPVILTTNDPHFSTMFDGCFEEINFETPSLVNVASYLQVLCLAENLRTDMKDFATFLTTNNCDIRQSLLSLQFWVRSGGGFLKEKILAIHGGREGNGTPQIACTEEATNSKSNIPQTGIPLQDIPKCDIGCIENLLGLKNIFLPSEDMFSFLKQEIMPKRKWGKLTHLLTEFQMKNVDLLYSNLEFVLPFPVQILPEPTRTSNLSLKKVTAVSSNDKSVDADYSEEVSPAKKARRSKRQKTIALLDDSDLFETELNYSEFLTLPSNVSTTCSEENKEGSKFEITKEKQLKLEIPAMEKSSPYASSCLNLLTELMDNMSFLDCCLNTNVQEPKEFCRNEAFNWTNSKIKNGLCDEFSLEHTDWHSSQSCSELKAAVEALSFRRCTAGISQSMETCLNSSRTLGKYQAEELTLHVSKDRTDVYFSQSAASLSIHRKAQERSEIIKTVFSSRTPLNLGNKQASITEYLPTLRSICRSEKFKEQEKAKRRFLHYLEGIHLEIPKETMNSLEADFP